MATKRRFLYGVLLCSFFSLALPVGLLAQDNAEKETSTAAQEKAEAQPEAARPNGLHAIDWTIIFLYAASTIALGAYFSRRQSTAKEYFIGSGNMNPILVGVSLFATLLSTISYLSMPGEIIGKGPVNMATMIGYPFVFLIVSICIIPVYMRQRVTSAYEMLEIRLGYPVRVLGAAMFVLLRLVWMSLLIYLAAKALTEMLGVAEENKERCTQIIVVVTGVVALIYTTLGGLRAVVITDCLQTVLLFGGAVLVIITVTVRCGGFSWFPTQWEDHWDNQPIFSLDPSERVTFVGSILSMIVWYVATAAGDQTSVQRFMATRDEASARKAFKVQLIVSIVVGLTLSVVGFALLGYFRQFPTSEVDLANNADFVFPHYISFYLPPGVSGLVVSAMFAAAMSSIDSGVNSITAVITSDFLSNTRLKPRSDQQQVKIARVCACAIGGIVVVGSAFIGYVPGNITAVTQKTSNLLVTPIFALFFFALFVKRATTPGVITGAFFGILTAVLIGFSGPIKAAIYGLDPSTVKDPISFQWIGITSLLVNIVVGLLVSRVWGTAKSLDLIQETG